MKEYTGIYSSLNWDVVPYATTTYAYNVLDLLTQVQDAAGNTTRISYDPLGRKTGMVDPDMGAWSYGYDAAGNLTSQTDARQCSTTFTYDALNRLTGKSYSGAACATTASVTYTYDQGTNGIGRRTRMDDGSGYTTWSYDARGRVTEETKVISGTGGGTFKTQRSYDALDRVVWMKYPGGNAGQIGEQVNFAYNAAARLNTVSGSATYVGGTTYNALGQVTERRLGSTTGVLRQLYTYSAAENYRLTALQSGTNSPNYDNRQDLSYTYDDAGNVLSITDTAAVGGSQTQNFSYDDLDRLVMAQASGGSYGTYPQETYVYNAIGNLTSKAGRSQWYGGQSPSCPDGSLYKPHAVVTAGSDTFCYDRNGNQVRRTLGGTTYTLIYDVENRLVGVSGGASASFVYDGDGQRVKATFGSTTTVYVGDYYEQTGSTVKKYYYANGRRVAMRVGSSTVYYLLTDHLGSTAITAYSSGGRKAELRYKAWGETRYTYSTTPTAYHFTGQREDATIGLYFYQARYYDQALGRFVQADTIVPAPGKPAALNRYSYALNNPARYRDPSGHAVCVDAECAWIVHPVSGEIRQRGPTNSPPEQPQVYNPAESYQQAMGLVNEFRGNAGPFERDLGPTSSLTQDIMYSSGIQEFHRVWAGAGYPDTFKWHHHVDVWEGGSYPVRFVKSMPGYIGAQVNLVLAGAGLGSKTPEGSIDAVNGTIGSLDTIQVKRVGSGWVKVEVHNRMDWQRSGLRIPGGNASLWDALDALKVPGTDSTLGDVWISVVGGSHPTEQTFYWWEPMPGSR